ncbi:MAG: TolC family protein [bacterium]|nr:TolC family protein [bacterium]
MKNIIVFLYILILVVGVSAKQLLNIEEFVILATAKNSEFEEILIAELQLKYQPLIGMPSEELLMAVKSSYSFGELDPIKISLSRLFLNQGLTTSLSYIYDHENDVDPKANIAVSQSLIRNAFGRLNRLQLEKIDKENEVIYYQVVEAYEQYLAELMTFYYSWSLAYANLQLAQRNYDDSLTLYQNMQAKNKHNIVSKSDLTQSYIQVIIKKESLGSAKTDYKKYYNHIKQSVRLEKEENLVPDFNLDLPIFDADFLKSYQGFKENSRTYYLFKIVNDSSLLDLKISKEDLADSLLVSAAVSDNDTLKKSFSVGLEYQTSFFDHKNAAIEQVSEIAHDANLLVTGNNKYDVETQLLNLYEDIKLMQSLIETADDKVKQSEIVMKEDKKYYLQGRLSFNDYLDSINRFEQFKFQRISRTLSLRILILNWKEATDILINKQNIFKQEIKVDV